MENWNCFSDILPEFHSEFGWKLEILTLYWRQFYFNIAMWFGDIVEDNDLTELSTRSTSPDSTTPTLWRDIFSLTVGHFSWHFSRLIIPSFALITNWSNRLRNTDLYLLIFTVYINNHDLWIIIFFQNRLDLCQCFSENSQTVTDSSLWDQRRCVNVRKWVICQTISWHLSDHPVQWSLPSCLGSES